MITCLTQLHEGLALPILEVQTDRTQLIRFAGAARDFARQHWDRPFMMELGQPDVLVHGWLTLSYMCRVVTDSIPASLAEIRSYSARYHRPMFPGHGTYGGVIKRSFLHEGKICIELDLWAKNADGDVTTSVTMLLGAVD